MLVGIIYKCQAFLDGSTIKKGIKSNHFKIWYKVETSIKVETSKNKGIKSKLLKKVLSRYTKNGVKSKLSSIHPFIVVRISPVSYLSRYTKTHIKSANIKISTPWQKQGGSQQKCRLGTVSNTQSMGT